MINHYQKKKDELERLEKNMAFLGVKIDGKPDKKDNLNLKPRKKPISKPIKKYKSILRLTKPSTIS